MAYASRAGRARTSSVSPQAHAICDRCGARVNRVDLSSQHEWAGSSLIDIRILVCNRCLDVPQEQNRAINIAPDPMPISNPRVEHFVQYETAGIGDFNGDFNHDFSGAQSITGFPSGIDPLAQMPLVLAQQWAVPLNIVSILSNGTATITVNTKGPHGLATNAQVSVEGLTNPAACSAASITVVTPTQFTYFALSNIPTASLYNAHSRVITLNAGLPYLQTTLPLVGPT